MPYEDIALEADDKMEKAVGVLADELRGVRTGRASAGLVDGVRVDYYGAPTPLKSLASVTVPEPRLLMVKPFGNVSIWLLRSCPTRHWICSSATNTTWSSASTA